MSTSGEIIFQITPEISRSSIPLVSQIISEPTIALTPTLSTMITHIESDDSKPLHVHHNFDKKDQAIIIKKNEPERIIRNFKPKKSYLRDVRSSKRRHT
jgi:hypothetical protein